MSETCWYHLECVQFSAGNYPFSLFSPIGLPFYFCWRNYSLLLYLQYHEKLCLPSSLECICDQNGFGLSLILINSRFVSYKVFTCGCSTVVHVLLNRNSNLPMAFMQHHSSLQSQWNLKHIPHETAVNPFTVLFLAVFYCQCRQNRWCHKEQAFMAIVPLVLWTFLVLLKVW